uniref:N-acetylneuraminate synthase n=1 Tax=Seriola lalandi dorsalis TaxID=1841481 RepID=A0A3B4WD02_SERLL
MPLQFELCPGRMIGGDHLCFIIAEIGQNHQGDIEISKENDQNDCAKLQKSELEYKFSKRALERPYNSKHSWGKTYGEHKRHLEFSHDQYRELKIYATEIGIFLTASGMDEMAVEFLHELDVPFFKVASCDANNFPYLEKTAKKGRPMVVSTGMQSMETIRRVYKTVKEHNQNFTLLQCTSAYPLDPKDVNLSVIAVRAKEQVSPPSRSSCPMSPPCLGERSNRSVDFILHPSNLELIMIQKKYFPKQYDTGCTIISNVYIPDICAFIYSYFPQTDIFGVLEKTEISTKIQL